MCPLWASILLVQTRQPRQNMIRASIANMWENEVIENYRMSPKRIQWLVALLEDKLDCDTGRNFPLSAEMRVSVVKLVNSILQHLVRRADLLWMWKQNLFLYPLLSPYSITILRYSVFPKSTWRYNGNFKSKRKSLCAWFWRVSLRVV